METPGSATRRSTRVKRKPFSDLTNSPSLSSLNPKPKPGPLPVPEPDTSDPQPVPSTSGDQENDWDQQGTPSKFMEVSPGFFSNADNNDEARISTVYTRVKARRKIVKAAPSSSCPPVGKNRSIEGSMRLKGNDADQSFSVRPDRAKKGCDGSILLSDTANFTGEQHAVPNNGSVRGFNVIDKIKVAVEKACPGVVSCADILAISARDSVVILGGPSWNVKLGRRDARTASKSAANRDIPPPTSSLKNLISKFAAKGLSTKDMVALSGGHTIGQARCTSFRAHIYNDTNIDASFAKKRRSNCPRQSGTGDTNLAPLDRQTPTTFDNNYHRNLVKNKGLLHSDQELFNGGSTDSLVRAYSRSAGTFSADFVAGMIKMGDISPLTGSKGEIRKKCSKIN